MTGNRLQRDRYIQLYLSYRMSVTTVPLFCLLQSKTILYFVYNNAKFYIYFRYNIDDNVLNASLVKIIAG